MENLDREIAEKVMGWEFIPSRVEQIGEYGVKHYFMATWKKDALEILDSNWHPSTDIAQAFQVVEKMFEKGWDFGCRKRDGALWVVYFEHYPATHDTYYGRSEILPEAICLAAREVR